MRIGDLNTLVAIEHRTHAADDLLNLKEQWGQFAKCWCACAVEAGSETAPDRQTLATNAWKLTTHWTEQLAGVTAEMRARLPDGKVLPIKSVVNEQNQNRTLIFTCEQTN